ncbi:MAG: 30S ribosomal protein S20 [Pirellulales bacterium]|nr:30S ribosomal protein S20 [Pirellulales bacterium]
MPNTKSAKKRLRQNVTRRSRNRSIKSSVRTQIHQVRQAIQENDIQRSEIAFRLTTKKLDQAAAKNVVHPNKAARLKSRLSKAIQKIKTLS